MSLNKLVYEGLVGDGLAIECRSIATATGSGSIIRGDLTVVNQSVLQSAVTCETTLTVVGNQRNFGLTTGYNPVTVFSSPVSSTPISVDKFVNGYLVLDSAFTGAISYSTSNIIDAYIGGNPTDGLTFTLTIVNRTSAVHQISSSETSAQSIRPRYDAATPSVTVIPFIRIAGIYTGILS